MGKARSNPSVGVRAFRAQTARGNASPCRCLATAQVRFLLLPELLQVFRCFPGWLVLESRRFDFVGNPPYDAPWDITLNWLFCPVTYVVSQAAKERSSGNLEVYYQRQHFLLNSSISPSFPPDAAAFYFAYIISLTSRV